MKSPIHLCTLFIAGSIFFLSGCSSAKKFVKLEPADIAGMVDAHQFIFVAEKMNPLRGPQRNLTSYYDLKVKGDTLDSFLPYFGRAFIAPIDPTKGGLRFTSTDFTYTVVPGNKKWDVTIVPKDVSEIQSLNFTIFNNGNTTLNVNSTHRDAISFYGHLEKIE